MLVALGSPGPAGNGTGLGHPGHQHLGHAADAVALLERSARGGDHKCGDTSLVELREEFATECRHRDQCRGEKRPGHEVDAARRAEPDIEQPRFPLLDPPHQPSVPRVLHAFHAREKQRAQGGCHGERHGKRRENGHDIRHG